MANGCEKMSLNSKNMYGYVCAFQKRRVCFQPFVKKCFLIQAASFVKIIVECIPVALGSTFFIICVKKIISFVK